MSIEGIRKRLPHSRKMVYKLIKRVRGWTSGQSLPVSTFVEYSPPGGWGGGGGGGGGVASFPAYSLFLAGVVRSVSRLLERFVSNKIDLCCLELTLKTLSSFIV